MAQSTCKFPQFLIASDSWGGERIKCILVLLRGLLKNRTMLCISGIKIFSIGISGLWDYVKRYRKDKVKERITKDQDNRH